MKKLVLLVFIVGIIACQQSPKEVNSVYHDNSGRSDLLSGGVQMIPINTPNGEFKVWTKRTGNNPTIKVLLLHGGPGITHEYFEACDSYFPGAEIEYYYYDQLGSHYSEKPNDTSLWNIPHFVEEVEQVRVALGLDSTNFYLYGNSWGGILGIEYALKYQENLKGLVVANMVSSIPHYNHYANEVLAPQLPEDVLKEIKELEALKDYLNPRYSELLTQHYYTAHLLRKPLDQWPDGVNRAFEHINYPLYLAMQGPSEFGIVGDAKLRNWDRSQDLKRIKVPTLVIGARYDTMDPEHMQWMSREFPNGEYLYCANGSHLAMYDDQEVFFEGLISWINKIDTSK